MYNHQGKKAWLLMVTVVMVMIKVCSTQTVASREDFGVPLIFYPLGLAAGDSIAPVNDDGSTGEIFISIPFPYFDRLHSSLYVNTNGGISFLAELSTFTPDPFPLENDRRLITPFWADVDTTENPGRVYYRETLDAALLERATDDVRSAFVGQTHYQATWLFIVTWYNVTFYGGNELTSTNTFQAVITTNGRHSFAIFNYGNITWTFGSASSETPAQAGFNAGDGIRYFSVPGSRTDEIVDVEETSNVGLPGRWVFRVDEADVIAGGCNTAGSLAVGPRFSSPFGGKKVTIAGPCFNVTVDDAVCRFSGIQVPATILDETHASCIVPITYQLGQRAFELSVDGGASFNHTGVFWFVEREQEDHRVTQDNPASWSARDLFVDLIITWNANTLKTSSLDVQFITLKRNDNTGEVSHEVVLISENVPNTGRFILPDRLIHAAPLVFATSGIIRIVETGFPSGRAQYLTTEYGPALWYVDRYLHEVAIRGRNSNSAGRRRRGIFDDVSGAYDAVTDWVDTTVSDIKQAVSDKLLDISDSLVGSHCDDWHQEQVNNPPDFESVLPSPCSMAQATRDPRFVADDACNMGVGSCDFFHKGAYHCVRSAQPSATGGSQQACYDRNGNLLSYENGGGTFDKSHAAGHDASGKWKYFDHFIDDVLPYLACCKLSRDRCGKYGEVRPTDDCDGYEEPQPAWSSGDPHIITPDGLVYTFNGIGEYSLLAIENTACARLNIQGRTTQYSNQATGESASGSVWAALAMGGAESSRVQIEVNDRLGVAILVDGRSVEFDDVPTQQYEGVRIVKTSDKTSIELCDVATIDVTETSGSLSFVIILSPAAKGLTSGLLGVWNGNPDDDLQTPSGTILPSNSSEFDIYYQFAELWRITAETSLFAYPAGTTYETFQNPRFVPVFGLPVSSEDELDRATEICGDNYQCKYDILVTGDEELANRTAQTLEEFDVIVEDTKPVVTCGFPTVPKNGFGNTTNGPAGALVVFGCSDGYKLKGSKTRVCQDDGTWSGMGTTCSEIDSSAAAMHFVDVMILALSVLLATVS